MLSVNVNESEEISPACQTWSSAHLTRPYLITVVIKPEKGGGTSSRCVRKMVRRGCSVVALLVSVFILPSQLSVQPFSLCFPLQISCSALWGFCHSSRPKPPPLPPKCETVVAFSSQISSLSEGAGAIHSRSLSPWRWRSVCWWEVGWRFYCLVETWHLNLLNQW